MTPIPPYFTLFQRLRELGDVIIIDQRGLGAFQSRFSTARSREPSPSAHLSGQKDLSPPSAVRLVLALRTGALKAQIPPRTTRWRARTTSTIFARLLGWTKIDIVAFSYGTRLALALVQRHGSHVGRVVFARSQRSGSRSKATGTSCSQVTAAERALEAGLDVAWTDRPAGYSAYSAQTTRQGSVYRSRQRPTQRTPGGAGDQSRRIRRDCLA